MGYRLNRLDEPIFMAGPKPLRTEFGIHLRLESCADLTLNVKSSNLMRCLKLMSLTDLLKRLHLCHWEQICWMIDNYISNFNYQSKWRSPFTPQELVLNYIDLNQQVSRLLQLTLSIYMLFIVSGVKWFKICKGTIPVGGLFTSQRYSGLGVLNT